jgi:hypothetical protein
MEPKFPQHHFPQRNEARWLYPTPFARRQGSACRRFLDLPGGFGSDRGGVYVVANIRGGGEFGED